MNKRSLATRLALTAALAGSSACGVNINLPGDGDPSPPVTADGDPAEGDNYVPEGGDETPYEPVRTPNTPLSECVPSVDWVNYDAATWGVGNTNLEITPNDGLVVRTNDAWTSEGLIIRADNGQLLAETWSRAFRAADDSFTKGLVVLWNGIEVRELITGELLAANTFEAETAQLETGAMSPDGTRVATLTCGTEEGRQLHIIDAESGIEESTFFLAGVSDWCSGTYDPRSAVQFTHDSSAVVISLDDDGELIHIDLETQEEYRVVAYAPIVLGEDEWIVDSRALLDFAISPQDDRVVTTGADGRLHVFKLPALVDAGIDVEVGQHLINMSAYLPNRLISPVEFSHDGNLLAFMGPDGKAYLADARNLDDTVCLEADFNPPEGTFVAPEMDADRPSHFAFARDDEALVVYFGQGLVSFSCGGAGPDINHSHPLAVDLDVPATTQRGAETVLTATHIGDPHIHAHSFYLDGELMHGGGLDRSTSWYPTDTGTFEITVVVDDGVNTGSATRTIEVVD